MYLLLSAETNWNDLLNMFFLIRYRAKSDVYKLYKNNKNIVFLLPDIKSDWTSPVLSQELKKHFHLLNVR